MTISSSEQLPARSPMPLMVHSTCPAPSSTAARLLATARPRSLWQWTLITALSMFGTRSRSVRITSPICVRRGVADRVGDVDRRGAGVDRRLDDLAEEVELGARGVLGRELDVVAVARGPLDARRPPGWTISSLSILSLYSRWMALVARKTWIRGSLGVLERLPRAVDVLRRCSGPARRPARPATALAICADRLEVARRGDREAGLDHVDAQVDQRVGDLQLLVQVHAGAGRLLAVAERGVEDCDVAHERSRGWRWKCGERSLGWRTPSLASLPCR